MSGQPGHLWPLNTSFSSATLSTWLERVRAVLHQELGHGDLVAQRAGAQRGEAVGHRPVDLSGDGQGHGRFPRSGDQVYRTQRRPWTRTNCYMFEVQNPGCEGQNPSDLRVQ